MFRPVNPIMQETDHATDIPAYISNDVREHREWLAERDRGIIEAVDCPRCEAVTMTPCTGTADDERHAGDELEFSHIERLIAAEREGDRESNDTYAERWANEIDETYADDLDPSYYLQDGDLRDGESFDDAGRRVLTKAAQCLRNGVPATFTLGEPNLVRHMMPAHAVHQSGAVRWVLEVYGDDGAVA